MLLSSFFFLLSGSAAAQCWTRGLSEEEQLTITRETFETELFAESIEAAKCYLEDFPVGSAREEMLFLQAESMRRSGKLINAVKVYDEFLDSYPKSKKYLETVMFQKGISQARSKEFAASVNSLKMFLLKFLKSNHRDKAQYWLGYSTSFQAEMLRKESRKKSLPEYRASTQHFLKSNPKSLNKKQRMERLYLMGRAWWFLDELTKAGDAWDEYLQYSESIEQSRVLHLKRQLAAGFQNAKNYVEAERWYARVVNEHPDSEWSNESAFWRAEMAYAGAIEHTKTEELDLKSKSLLVEHYKSYINKEDNEHLALAYYRIGVLQRTRKPHETISAFQKYLGTKDKTYANEVLYQLGYLYIETKQTKNAIDSFEKYISSGDKTHADEIHFRLGYLYIETRQPEKAISIFEKYLAENYVKHVKETRYRLGYLYIETLKPKKAIAIFKKYLSGGDVEHVSEIQLRLASLYIEIKQPKKAIEVYKQYLSRGEVEHVGEIQLRLALLYLETKQPKKAIEVYKQYLSGGEAEHVGEIQLRLASLYLETKQPKQAIEVYEQYLSRGEVKHVSEIQLRLASLYLQTKQPKQAIEVYKQYLSGEEVEHIGEIQLRLASLYLETKQPKQAIEVYKQYLSGEEVEHAGEIQLRLASLYLETQQPKKAIEVYVQYLAGGENKQVAEIQLRLASLYLETKQPEKAIEVFRQYLSVGENELVAEIQLRLASLYLENQQPINAIEVYEQYLSGGESEHVAEIQLKLASLYLETQQPNKAIEIYGKYLSGDVVEHKAETQLRLAYLYVETKQPQKAIEVFEKYLADGETEHKDEIQLRLASLYLETKQPDKAIEVFEKYLAEGDRMHKVETQIRLAYLYLENKQPQKAIEVFEKYLAEGGGEHTAQTLLRLGLIYLENKQPKKAIKNFEQYLASGGGEHTAETQLRLGFLYLESKQKKKAIKIFEKYLADGAGEHLADTQLRLGYLYLETKQPFLALAAFENARQAPEFQGNIDLLHTLMALYRDTASEEKYMQFLNEVKNNPKLAAGDRHEFQTQLFLEYYEQGKCDKLISELNQNPGYLKKSKNSNVEEWQHLLFLRGSCLFDKQKWEEARADFRIIREVDKYREQSIRMLLESHKQLEDWKSITWELQGVYERKSPAMTIPYYKLWIFASQRRQDFQRLERIKIIYERWKNSFPEDKQNLAQLQKYISESQLQELTRQENWAGLSSFIRTEVKAGRATLDDQRFSQLLFAEKKLDNWSGVLRAYALLRKHNREQSETLDALIDQATAAEKLGKKEISIEFYQRALKVKPLNEKEKNKQEEIKTFLAKRSFQKWIEKEEWSKVTQAIYKEVKANKRKLDDENFQFLLFAENQKSGSEKYNGILDAYALLAHYNKPKTLTLEAQIDQGYAAEKLGGYKRAKGYYRRALKKVPDENIDLVLQIVGELKRLYERTKDYNSLVYIYKRAYSALKKSTRPKKEYRAYAYLIGYHQFFNLKQTKNARIWLLRSDGGGSTSQELQAAYWVAKLDRDANKPDIALKRLKELSGRKIPKTSSLYVQTHFELGTLYHSKENWNSALMHYRLAAKARSPAKLKQIQKVAEQKAKEIAQYLKSLKASQG